MFILSMMVVVGAASAFPGEQLWAFDSGPEGLWSKPGGSLEGHVRSSAALSPDGATLYIGSYHNKVYALRTSTGEQQWAFVTGAVSYTHLTLPTN